jgi:hypothetical protein
VAIERAWVRLASLLCLALCSPLLTVASSFAPPTDAALRRLTLLEEPLVPMAGAGSEDENAALLEALHGWSADPTELRALIDFTTDHPASRWRPAVLVTSASSSTEAATSGPRSTTGARHGSRRGRRPVGRQ